MAFFPQVNNKKTLIFILISSMAVSMALYSNKSKDEKMPSAEIQRLDAMLLTDLKGQELMISNEIKATMDCAELKESDLKALFSVDNVNYDRCNIENCHINSYMIETDEISFMLTAGEEGNFIEQLSADGCNNSSSK